MIRAHGEKPINRGIGAQVIANRKKPQAKQRHAKTPPPDPPKAKASGKDLASKEEKDGSHANAVDSDQPSKTEVVINSPKLEEKPVALGPERPPDVQVAPTRPHQQVRPPPTFSPIAKQDKEIEVTPTAKGKGGNAAFVPDPMAQLLSTLGARPADEHELFERRLCAQQLGGLHPSTYRWLVFGKAPIHAIASPLVRSRNSAVEGVSDANSPHALNDLDPDSTGP